MRALVFDVNDQIIEKNSNCDFDNIVSGTEGYLVAKFRFNKEWEGYGKVAVFTNLSKTCPRIVKGNECIIPKEALDGDKFTVSVTGVKAGQRLTTNSVTVEQRREARWKI